MTFSTFKICILLVLTLSAAASKCQTLEGIVLDREGNKVPLVLVSVAETDIQELADFDGKFSIPLPEYGAYTVVFEATGFRPITDTVDLTRTSKIFVRVSLTPVVESLEDIVITAESDFRIINREPLAISSVGTKEMQRLTTDAIELLNRTSGIRIRQSGGLGSEINISIQGAQGTAIRKYYDGLPIKYLSRGLDINNLPLSQIDRIEVFRGVTPLEVGTDALGGGINIIPKKAEKSYLDVSYQVGSFNTHRPAVNLFYLSPKNFFVGSNWFYNYSDNDYRIDAHDFNEFNRKAENVINVRRFHNQYRSIYGDISLGIRNQKWADELKVTILYNDQDTELQTPVVFNPVRPIGAVTGTEEGFTAIAQYELNLFDDKLSLKSKSSYGVYDQWVNDSTSFFYNWYGERLETPNFRGAELFSTPASINIKRNVLLNRTTAKWRLMDGQMLTFSNMVVRQDREGDNEFIEDAFDPFRFPADLTQNYAGLEWSGSWLRSKLETVVTYKNYHFNANATSLEEVLNGQFERRTANQNFSGGNVAIKYAFNRNFFFRSSFESAYRIPDEVELFGNQSTIRSNIDLKPEQSDNINFGGFYRTLINGKLPLAVEINGFYRYQRDRIILLASGFDLAQYFNEEEVEIRGFDAYVSLQPWPKVQGNLALTYQDVRIQSALVGADEDLIGTRVPNIPAFFMSVDWSYDWEGVAQEDDLITFRYYYDFVDSFSSIREANAFENVANFVPEQDIHSFDVTYVAANERWSISARLNNIFDDDVYDNFRVQRPGRNFNLKLRYVVE
ncbi:MAG: TonB-dependent receptor plug domain-containing protein [Bacteroidota bacterium]